MKRNELLFQFILFYFCRFKHTFTPPRRRHTLTECWSLLYRVTTVLRTRFTSVCRLWSASPASLRCSTRSWTTTNEPRSRRAPKRCVKCSTESRCDQHIIVFSSDDALHLDSIVHFVSDENVPLVAVHFFAKYLPSICKILSPAHSRGIICDIAIRECPIQTLIVAELSRQQ